MAVVNIYPNSVVQNTANVQNPTYILTINDSGAGFPSNNASYMSVDLIQQTLDLGTIKLVELFMRVRGVNGADDQIISGQVLTPQPDKTGEALLAVSPPVAAWTNYSIVVMPGQIPYTWAGVNAANILVLRGHVTSNFVWECDCVWLKVHYVPTGGDGITGSY